MFDLTKRIKLRFLCFCFSVCDADYVVYILINIIILVCFI